ncbi:hypothetical protein [Sphingomicrobium nitratireducens]|uniref:hypothetical protein n=1 Tax=Sphingomicrobium nitratireducens TaxID=2964666 RepID=UPI0022408FE5
MGWILTDESRRALLDRFPPRYPNPIAHHVTLAGHRANAPVPAEALIEVVGHADDGRALEALVVSVDGTLDRPDGSIFHITWSLDPQAGVVPKDSNALLATRVWVDVAPPISVATRPGFTT